MIATRGILTTGIARVAGAEFRARILVRVCAR